MLIVTLSLLVGIFFGIFFRDKKNFTHYTDIISSILMVVLLFILGMSIGTNRELVKIFRDIGITGLIVAILTILGSSGVSLIVYRLFFDER